MWAFNLGSLTRRWRIDGRPGRHLSAARDTSVRYVYFLFHHSTNNTSNNMHHLCRVSDQPTNRLSPASVHNRNHNPGNRQACALNECVTFNKGGGGAYPNLMSEEIIWLYASLVTTATIISPSPAKANG